MDALPEPVIQTKPDTMPTLVPDTGRPYNPVVTLNGWTLPWRMNNGVKEFHLVAEPVVREMAPGFKAHLWGYNGQSPGPTIEVVEGDRVRLFVTNRLGNLAMMNHPIHLHGHEFLVTGTDGGPTPKPSHQPEVTADIAVGQMRQIDLLADEEGDWAFHCHKIKHGEIKSLDRPPMTMVFQVKDKGLLDKLQPGDKVRFPAINESGCYTVTAIEVQR